MSQINLHPALSTYVEGILPDVETIPAERRASLEKLAAFVEKKVHSGQPADLTFICTHNSRRSQMGQVWAAVAAAYYGVEGVRTWSGGTESTAFNPRAVQALRRAGFQIEDPGGENPHYTVSFAEQAPTLECFSKKYDDPFNPAENFAAVMTCSQADEACPFVRGAGLRLAVPYEDPKVADGTPEEAARYDERCRQIATEMMYLFAKVGRQSRA